MAFKLPQPVTKKDAARQRARLWGGGAGASPGCGRHGAGGWGGGGDWWNFGFRRMFVRMFQAQWFRFMSARETAQPMGRGPQSQACRA